MKKLTNEHIKALANELIQASEGFNQPVLDLLVRVAISELFEELNKRIGSKYKVEQAGCDCERCSARVLN